MAYYFRDEQINKVMSLIPDEYEQKQEHVKGAETARYIISKINTKDIMIDNNVLYICRDACSTSYDLYSERECSLIENELKAEIKDIFGVDADVTFVETGSYNKEPDSPPPLYWGEPETVYVYSLSIKVIL